MKALHSTLPRAPFAEPVMLGRRAPRGLAARTAAVVDRVLQWQERISERQRMRGLTDRELQDIGVRRADIELEASKPFWRT